MKRGILEISVERPSFDLFGVKFNRKVNKIINEIKDIKSITDCWAVDMNNSDKKDVAIVASLITDTRETALSVVNHIGNIGGVIEVSPDISPDEKDT